MRATFLLLLLAMLPACASAPSGPADVLVARTYVDADYEEVWRAFTTAEGYAPWYSTPCRAFGGAAGEACVWAVGRRVTCRGTVQRLERGRGLAHTFAFEGFGFDEGPTVVEIDVVQQGPVVLVAVTHDCRGAPRTRDLITAVGWAKNLARLKTLLETGEVMPWPEGTAGHDG